MFNGGASQHIGGFKAPSPSPRMPTPRPHDPYNGHTPAPGPGGFLAPAPPLFTSASDSGVRTVPRPPMPRTLSAPKLIIPHVSFERPKKSRPPKKEQHHHSHHATHAHHTHHTHHTSTTHLQTTYAPRPEHSHPVPGLVKPPKPAKPVQHVHGNQGSFPVN
ncbi:hypothetical protein BD410DRAFT_651933 [Rickenella mellea]|uniref:Uncharacterized protein n=1 Tax=Rickenella mellea TaxID=50990 RepID=A0A4Y7PLW5_9AGAM|nr:hypothetical protein BD410DRAFT_651933 [Rickenella mellea]